MGSSYTSMSSVRRRQLLVNALQNFGWVCCICGLPIRAGDASLQHVKPRSKGGTEAHDNLRPAHKSCNYSLGNRELDPAHDTIENGEAFFWSE